MAALNTHNSKCSSVASSSGSSNSNSNGKSHQSSTTANKQPLFTHNLYTYSPAEEEENNRQRLGSLMDDQNRNSGAESLDSSSHQHSKEHGLNGSDSESDSDNEFTVWNTKPTNSATISVVCDAASTVAPSVQTAKICNRMANKNKEQNKRLDKLLTKNYNHHSSSDDGNGYGYGVDDNHRGNNRGTNSWAGLTFASNLDDVDEYAGVGEGVEEDDFGAVNDADAALFAAMDAAHEATITTTTKSFKDKSSNGSSRSRAQELAFNDDNNGEEEDYDADAALFASMDAAHDATMVGSNNAKRTTSAKKEDTSGSSPHDEIKCNSGSNQKQTSDEVDAALLAAMDSAHKNATNDNERKEDEKMSLEYFFGAPAAATPVSSIPNPPPTPVVPDPAPCSEITKSTPTTTWRSRTGSSFKQKQMESRRVQETVRPSLSAEC